MTCSACWWFCLATSFWRRDCVAEVHGAAAFADVIAIPCRQADSYVACYDRLTAEAGMSREIGGKFNAIKFIVVGFG